MFLNILFINFYFFVGGENLTNSLPAILGTVVAITIIYHVTLFSFRSANKRDRLHSLFPVLHKNTGLMRICLTLVFWIPTVLLLLIADLSGLNALFSSKIVYLFAANGLILVINAFFYISKDMEFIFTRKKNFYGIYFDQFVSVMLVISIISLFSFAPLTISLGNPDRLKEIYYTMFFSPIGVLISNLAGIYLTYLSINLYNRRKSYLV